MSGRKSNGQFDQGNHFSPGRPKRATELEYLRTLSDACNPEDWKAICQKVVADAKAGDEKARDWLAKYLIGEGASLTLLAKLESLNVSPAGYVQAMADAELNPGGLDAILKADQQGQSVIERAAKLAQQDLAAEQSAA